MDRIKECLTILELPEHAGIEDIRNAYRDLVRVWHPDRFEHDQKLKAKASEKLKEINGAYDYLSVQFTAPRAALPPAEQPPESPAGESAAEAELLAAEMLRAHELRRRARFSRVTVLAVLIGAVLAWFGSQEPGRSALNRLTARLSAAAGLQSSAKKQNYRLITGRGVVRVHRDAN